MTAFRLPLALVVATLPPLACVQGPCRGLDVINSELPSEINDVAPAPAQLQEPQAMRFTSGIIQKASGSAGGYTYSHNAGGMYIRARSTPTDPGTGPQQQIRAIIASLVNHWVTTLTTVQRDAWNTYAANVALIDVFGDPRFRSGINHFVRSNAPRLQRGIGRIDDGPTTFNLGEFTSPIFTITPATNMVNVTFTVGDAWVSEDGAAMLLWGSRPKSPAIDFFKGPYKMMMPIQGDSGSPPTSPTAIPVPYMYTVGQKGFLRANVSRADGRLSTPFLSGVLAT